MPVDEINDIERVTGVFRPGLFNGHTVLVTGGGTGIGFATARKFGHLGARVIVAARSEDTLAAAANRLRDEGIDADWRQVNIRDNDEVDALMAGLVHEDRLPDILINNAGGQFVSKAIDITPNGFRSVMDLNVQGTWQMILAFAKQRVSAGLPGVITNIVFEHIGAYRMISHAAAARAAVTNLTKSLALEWGEYGIRVNAVGPGYTDTEAIRLYDEDHHKGAVEGQPIARLGRPEEIADAVCFLCSPASAFTTGAYLVVDGGHALMTS